MFTSLITRPLRIATRGVQITLHTAHEAVGLAEGLVALVADRLTAEDDPGSRVNGHTHVDDRPPYTPPSNGHATATPERPGSAFRPTTPEPPPTLEPEPAPSAPPARPEPVAPPPTSAHVSEEPELVEEVADPGAEDGAGAELHIAEPWHGYRAMKAADVIDRLASADRAELAAVELYELSSRKRKSVISAAQRALKQASPPR